MRPMGKGCVALSKPVWMVAADLIADSICHMLMAWLVQIPSQTCCCCVPRAMGDIILFWWVFMVWELCFLYLHSFLVPTNMGILEPKGTSICVWVKAPFRVTLGISQLQGWWEEPRCPLSGSTEQKNELPTLWISSAHPPFFFFLFFLTSALFLYLVCFLISIFIHNGWEQNDCKLEKCPISLSCLVPIVLLPSLALTAQFSLGQSILAGLRLPSSSTWDKASFSLKHN